MNWAQENKTLAGIVGVMVVGGLALGVWLFLSWSGFTGSLEKWKTTQSRLASIQGQKVAPTADNVAVREKQLGDYAEKVDQLRSALLTVQVRPKPMSETEFQAKLKERASEMKRMGKASGMADLPDDFALGFDKYATQPPRSAEIAAALNIHLDAMEKLVTTCIEAGVTSIDMLERTKLPDEEAPAPPKAAATKARPKAAPSKRGAKKPVITEEAAMEPVLDRFPIKLIVTTDQGPFQTLINTLCHPGKMPYFLVVRQLRIENSRLDGPTKDEIVQRKNAVSQTTGGNESAKPTEPPKPGAPVLITPPKPAPQDAFDIMGGEHLKVYLEIDYIRFRPAAKVEDEEAPAEAPAPAAPAKS